MAETKPDKIIVTVRRSRGGKSYYHEQDFSNYGTKDGRGRPLDDDNDPLLEAFKEGKR